MEFDFLLEALSAVAHNPKCIAMWIIGGLLIFIAIKYKIEPALLLPMGFGAILVNIPLTNVLTACGDCGEILVDVCSVCGTQIETIAEGCANCKLPHDLISVVSGCPTHGVINNETVGIIEWLFEEFIEVSEAMPILLFIGIGAMIDFGPLLSNPKLFLIGGAAQFGIFATILLASLFFPIEDAASIGIIGAADGPTSILVANTLKSQFMGPIMVVAYSYMALVPIIQPPVVRMITTKKERMIRMPYKPQSVTRLTKILFPIVVTMVAGLIAPKSLALVGFLMFGNLIRECGVLGTMSDTAQNNLANVITLLLGITIACSMQADAFIRPETLLIMGLGIFAFVFDTVAGVLFCKLLNVFSKNKINPMLGAAGISAFPMAARTVQTMGLKEDNQNHLLMHAIGANVSGQIASAIVGGLILSLL